MKATLTHIGVDEFLFAQLILVFDHDLAQAGNLRHADGQLMNIVLTEGTEVTHRLDAT